MIPLPFPLTLCVSRLIKIMIDFAIYVRWNPLKFLVQKSTTSTYYLCLQICMSSFITFASSSPPHMIKDNGIINSNLPIILIYEYHHRLVPSKFPI